MTAEGSITRWLEGVQHGDREAIERLWNLYFARLVGLARHKLRGTPRRVIDEEDVALSAFDSFCRHAAAGHFPDLEDRESLWRILSVLTSRKALHVLRDQNRQKRGGGTTHVTWTDPEGELLKQALGREPPPELGVEVAEECHRLLALLNDPELVCVALWRMEGQTVGEIAERLGYAPRSIKRKLQLIRDLWAQEVERA